MKEEKKCCLECFETKGEYFVNEYYCKNDNCKCHNPTIKSEFITKEQDEAERKDMCNNPLFHDFSDFKCEKCYPKEFKEAVELLDKMGYKVIKK